MGTLKNHCQPLSPTQNPLIQPPKKSIPLKEYTTPIREKISQLGVQVANAAKSSSNVRLQPPSQAEVEVFAEQAKKTLHDLKFPAQRAIMLNVVNKVVGTREFLQVTGNIPLNQNVGFISYNRHCMNTTRHSVLDESLKFIPFSFTIKLPPPVKARRITARDRQGKIVHSVPAVI